MNDKEKEDFKQSIVNQVQSIVDIHTKATRQNLESHRKYISSELPKLLEPFVLKENRLFILFNSILNGVVVGGAVYAAMHLF